MRARPRRRTGAALGLAVLLAAAPARGQPTAVADSAAAARADSAGHGRPATAEHAKRWALGLVGAVGTAAAGDVNRAILLTNLAFASAIQPVRASAEAAGELSYGVSERVSVVGHLGYLWREHSSGRLARRVSAVPATLGVTYHALAGSRLRAGPTAAFGLLLRATYKGQDPLGGVRSSGSGKILEGGLEAEYFLARSLSLSARGLGRWAVARHALADGGDIDLSGVLARGALRIYFRR